MMDEMGMWAPGLVGAAGLPLLVLLLGAAAAVALMAWGGRRTALTASGPSLGPGESAAVAVAKERYARGEIDHAEFDRLLDVLLRAQGRPGERPR